MQATIKPQAPQPLFTWKKEPGSGRDSISFPSILKTKPARSQLDLLKSLQKLPDAVSSHMAHSNTTYDQY